MDDKKKYPQIPSTVWWGVRALLHRSPSVVVNESFLSAELAVQEVAAKAYINELKNVGLLNEDGKATALAAKWRLDDSYEEAVKELVRNNYDENLSHLSPFGTTDRTKVVNWFMTKGLGKGAAGNKAATFFLISSPTPNDAPGKAVKEAFATKAVKKPDKVFAQSEKRIVETRKGSGHASGEIPLNVNVQIHISADAGSEQIESIFKAMRRYLYDPNS